MRLLDNRQSRHRRPVPTMDYRIDHCESNISELNDEQVQQLQREQQIKKKQMFINHSFLALILFLGGFFCLYFLQPQKETLEWYAYTIAIGVGCIWYLINRIILVTLKKKR